MRGWIGPSVLCLALSLGGMTNARAAAGTPSPAELQAKAPAMEQQVRALENQLRDAENNLKGAIGARNAADNTIKQLDATNTQMRNQGRPMENYAAQRKAALDVKIKAYEDSKVLEEKVSDLRDRLEKARADHKALLEGRMPAAAAKTAPPEAEKKPATVFKLKDGTQVAAVQVIESPDAYTIKDDKGKFRTLNKSDVDTVTKP